MTDRDTITLPREVVEKALEALGEETAWFGPTPKGAAAITALRTALAAEPTKPSDSLKAMKEAFRILTKPESGYLRWQVSDACDILRTAIRTAQSALAAEKRHPDYVIGNHWFETAYERLCAGEAEDAILEDYEVVREPRLRDLRRDAERYRWLREKDGIAVDVTVFGSMEANLDAAIDAAMEASTAPASAAADASTAPEAKP